MTQTIVRLTFSFFLLLTGVVFAELPKFDSDSLYQHGSRLRQENRFDSARLQWEKVLDQSPDHLPTLIALTELNHFLGKFELCIDYGTRALQQERRDPDLYFYVGTTLSYVGRNNEAVDLLQRGLQLDPRRIEFLFHLADIEMAQSNFSLARKWLKKSLNQLPRNPEAAQKIGMTWGAEGKKKKATEWFKKALKWKEDFAPALFSLALLDIENKQWPRAKQRLEQVIEIEKVHPRAFFYLALLAQKQNQTLKEYYWLNRASVYFSKKSDELAEIIQRKKEIELEWGCSASEMAAFVTDDFPVQLGDSKQEVRKKIGEPFFRNEKGTFFLYSEQHFALRFEGEQLVEIQIDPDFKGNVHGVRLGEESAKLQQIYGPPIEEAQNRRLYRFKNQVVTFLVNQGRITEIILTLEI